MASLTPGILGKLLDNSKNRSVKVTGQHRSALLQVIEIVPSLGADSDPWKNRGFYLKVSDSAHKTYVSMPEEDVDLIFNNHIQLGEFIHVTRFDSGSPFPVVRGVKAAGRKCGCVGTPVELVVEKARSVKKKAEVEEGRGRRVSVGGRSEVMEMRRLSLDSMRRGWEKSSGDVNNSRPRSKAMGTSSDSASVVSDAKASPRKASLLKDRILSNSPLKCQNNTFSINITKKPSNKDIKLPKEATTPSRPKEASTPSRPKELKEASTPSRPKEASTPSLPKELKEASTPGRFIKVPLKFQEWSDQSISWDLLPTGIHDSGKEAIRCRNTSFSAAVDALHEATASENVIQCMSRFAELCESKDSPGILIENFLDLYQTMQRKASEIDALLKARFTEGRSSVPSCSQLSSEELHKVFLDKNDSAASWVQAAIENNLSKFSLLKKQDSQKPSDHHHYVVLEPPIEQPEAKKDCLPHIKRSPQNQGSVLDSNRKGGPLAKRRLGHPVIKKTNDENVAWSKGEGLKEVASVAERLLLTSRGWFLKYLEDSLNVGFGLNSGEGDSEVGTLLGQLKRVNQWLEDATGDRFEVDEKVEKLRKKLYGFLLENLDSAIVTVR